MSLWPNNYRIPIIGGSGEYASGKTMFGYTMVMDANGSIPANSIRVWDCEHSSTGYSQIFGLSPDDYIDVPGVMRREHPQGWLPTQLAEWWIKDMRSIQPGKYQVAMLDPASEIESAIASYVREHPTQFGYTSTQFDRSNALFWGAVKDFWKQLLSELATRVETFYFTVHMRMQFRGATPTGKREAKGKSTLSELAALFLEFNREPDQSGNVPKEPRAIVRKNRLIRLVEGKIEPILPPALPTATPEAIRQYILTPPNYEKLKKGEKAFERQLSEDDRLALQASIAESTAEAERNHLERERLKHEAMKRQAELRAKQPASSITPATVNPSVDKATPEQIETIKHAVQVLIGAGRLTMEVYKKAIAKRGVQSARDLSIEQADEVMSNLLKKIDVEDALKAAFAELQGN